MGASTAETIRVRLLTVYIHGETKLKSTQCHGYRAGNGEKINSCRTTDEPMGNQTLGRLSFNMGEPCKEERKKTSF